MEKSLSYQARRALLQQAVPQYREALPSQKRTLLDVFVETTGYNRTYARWLLNHAEEVQQTLQRPHPRQYGPDVQHALFLVWNAANRICAKRLIPFLPTLLEDGLGHSMSMPQPVSISLHSKSRRDAKKTLMIVLYYFRKQRSGHVNKLNRYWIGTSYQVRNRRMPKVRSLSSFKKLLWDEVLLIRRSIT